MRNRGDDGKERISRDLIAPNKIKTKYVRIIDRRHAYPTTGSPQKCLKVAGMSAAGATRFMEAHQLVTIEDMLLFCPSKYQDLMKIKNG